MQRIWRFFPVRLGFGCGIGVWVDAGMVDLASVVGLSSRVSVCVVGGDIIDFGGSVINGFCYVKERAGTECDSGVER